MRTMKKTLACILMSLTTLAYAQREAVLNFNLKNVRANDTLTLSWGANNKSVTPHILSMAAVDAKEVALPLNEPRVVVLGVKGQSSVLELLLSPGETISVKGRVRNGNTYRLHRLDVEGAQHQEHYTHVIRAYRETIDSLEDDVKSQFKDVVRVIENSKMNDNEEAIAAIYQTPRGKEYIERTIQSFEERGELFEEVVRMHRDSFMGPLFMLRLAGRLGKGFRELYNSLGDAAKLSYYGREVKDEVYPPTLVGDIAPTVTVKNLNGEEKLLSFIHHNNRYLLLDFWASWCQPCHKEIPNLKAIYEKYHARGLDIVGISADHNEEDWRSTLEEMKEPWCNYLDINRQAITEYKVQYIPSIFIIDAQGNIIAEKLRGKELADYIDRLFAE